MVMCDLWSKLTGLMVMTEIVPESRFSSELHEYKDSTSSFHSTQICSGTSEMTKFTQIM